MRLPKLYQIGIRWPAAVLLASLVLTVLAFFQLKKLPIVTDLTTLLPKQTGSVKNLERFKKNFGGLGYLVIVVEGDDPAAAEDFAGKLAKRIEGSESVRYVEFQPPREYFSERQWLYLDVSDLLEMERRTDRALQLQKKGVSPVFNDLMDFGDPEDRPDLTFEDIRKKYKDRFGQWENGVADGKNKFFLLWVKPKESSTDIEGSRKLLAEMKTLEKAAFASGSFPGVKVGYTGDYASMVEEVDFTAREITWISALVTGLLFVILIGYFRRWSSAFLIGLPLTVSVVWTGGLVYLILGHLNLITGFAAAILAGLGSDYGIFLLTRFYQERESGSDFEKAARLAFADTGRATFGSMVTTVGAFLALVFSHFGVFVEFGIVGAIGLLMNYFGMMLLMPSLLALAARWGRNPAFAKIAGWDRKFLGGRFSWTDGWEKLFLPYWSVGAILAVGGLLAASAWTLPAQSQIIFEAGQMDTQKLPGTQLYSRVREALGVTLKPTVLMMDGFEEGKKVYQGLQTRLDVQGKSEFYNRVVGLAQFIPEGQGEKRRVIGRIEKLYEALTLVNADKRGQVVDSMARTLRASDVSESGLPVEVMRRFRSASEENLYAVYVYPSIGRQASADIETYYQSMERAKRDLGVEWEAVDSSFIQRDILKLIEPEASRGFFLIMCFFAVFLFITVRPASRAFLIFLHLVASLILLSGTLYLLDIKLNVLNIVVIPIILGTGIDCFIHFSHRMDEETDIPKLMKMELPAIFVSSLTSIIGFGGLVLTSSQGLRSVGWVAVLGLTIVTLLCAFLFPRCLLLLARRRNLPPLKIEESVSET